MKREELINKAAVYLGIPRSTLYQAVERGEIRSRELHLGTVLIDLDAAEKWKKRRLAETEPKRGRPRSWDDR